MSEALIAMAVLLVPAVSRPSWLWLWCRRAVVLVAVVSMRSCRMPLCQGLSCWDGWRRVRKCWNCGVKRAVVLVAVMSRCSCQGLSCRGMSCYGYCVEAFVSGAVVSARLNGDTELVGR